MQINTKEQLEKKVEDMGYPEVIKFAKGYNGTFLSIVRPLSLEDRERYDNMVARYRRRYVIDKLEWAVATYEGLSGIDIVKLMAYIRPDNTQHKQKKSNKRVAVSLQS